MSDIFNPQAGLVVVRAELSGPTGTTLVRLALDTGATSTLISVGPLASVGYDPSLVSNRVQVTTGSGVEFVPRILVTRLRALARIFHTPARRIRWRAAVAQVSNLLYRRFPIGMVSKTNHACHCEGDVGWKPCDTADWKSALQECEICGLGHERLAFAILSHTLPPSSGIDGLLGLDFLRGHRLEIDFVSGRISLTSDL